MGYRTGMAALLLLAPLTAGAQLSLEECRKAALENNNALKAAQERENEALYNKKEAFAEFLPKASASAGYAHFNRNLHLISDHALPSSVVVPTAMGDMTLPLDALGQGVYKAGEVDLSNNWIAGVNLTQPLFAGGRIVAYNDLRKHALELATAIRQTKAADLIVEVDCAYWQTVSLAHKRTLAESSVELLQKLCGDTEHLYNEGLATKADKLSLDVRLSEAQLTLTRVENGLSLSRMNLATLCGLDAGAAEALADEQGELAGVRPSGEAVYDMDRAVDSRSEVKSLEMASQIALRQQKIAFAEFLPTLGLTTGYNWTRPNFFNGAQYKMGGMWDIGVVMTMPLSFGNPHKYSAAKAHRKAAEYELQSAKEKLRLQISQADYKLGEANKKLASAVKNAERADENLMCAEEGFREGVISSSELLMAHTAWMAAQSEKIDSRIDCKLCRLYLDRALGNELME